MTAGAADRTPRAFDARIVAALILVGIFTFAGFLVLGAYAPSLRSGNDGGAHGLSRSAVGYGALADLLAREGRRVVLSRSAVGTDRNAFWVVTPPGPHATVEPLPGAGLPTLLVLPKWHTRPDEAVRGWVDLVGAARPRALSFTVQGHEMTIRLNGYAPDDASEPGPEEQAEPLPTDGPVADPGEAVAEELAEEVAEGEEGAGGDDADEDGGDPAAILADVLVAGGTPLSALDAAPLRIVQAAEPGRGAPSPPSAAVTVTGLQTVEGFHLRAIWTDEAGRTILGRVVFPPGHIDSFTEVTPEGPVTIAVGDGAEVVTNTYVLSDPDLLNTLGLATPEGAALATGLIGDLAGGRAVFFDLAGAGFGRTDNLLTLAIEPPFTAATITVLLAGGLLAWAATARFGPPLADPVGMGLGKAALADQAATLLEASGRDVTLGPRYAGLTRRRVARLLGNEAMPDAALARTAKRAGLTDLAPASAAAHQASDAPALLRAARRLHDLTTHLTDRKPE